MTRPIPPAGPENAEAIEDLAAQWLVRAADGLTPDETQQFARWRQADPRHDAAVARLAQAEALLTKLPFAADRLRETHAVSAAAPATGPVITLPRAEDVYTTRPPRRSFAAGIAAAAILLFAALGWWLLPTADAPVRYATGAAGYERISLPDGSALQLNAHSSVLVDFSPQFRRVTLVEGEAHFTVAHDTARPFLVGAGGFSVRAVGTAFNVRLAPGAVEVLVTEGKVQVSAAPPAARSERDPATPAASFVDAGHRMLIPRAANSPAALPAAEVIAPAAIDEALAWQQRKLLFVDTPLREVVAQFNRHNRIQVLIGDPALADRPVGGTFAADNVEAFVRLLEQTGDIVREPRGPDTIVLRRAP